MSVEPPAVANARWIELTKGRWALVDEEMFEPFSRFNWQFDGVYAGRCVWNKELKKGYRVRMHCQIFGSTEVDHKNGNKLDNRIENLRAATSAQNGANAGMRKNNMSGFKGVCWDKTHEKWVADIRMNKRRKRLGYFNTAVEAAQAYNAAAVQYHGEFAVLNQLETR